MNIPILVYSFSMLTDTYLFPTFVARLAAKYPGVVSIKDSVIFLRFRVLRTDKAKEVHFERAAEGR